MEGHSEVRRESAPACPRHHRLLRALAWGIGALGLMAVGAVGALLGSCYLGGVLPVPVATAPLPSPAEPPTASVPTAPAEVVLSPEAVARAGIKTARVEVIDAQATIQLPGTVMADAYREVKVVPIVGGIVTKVHLELGTTVKRGAPLVTLSSSFRQAG